MTVRQWSARLVFAAIVLVATTAPVAWAQQQSMARPDTNALATSATAASSSQPSKSPKDPIKADDPSLSGYTIGEEDVLDIDVWREKELSVQVVVRPDGKITVPLVSELYVLGLTPLQLRDTLIDKLQPFVTAPQVTVSVRQINSRKVYVIGQVVHEGVFPCNSSTTTVSEILVEAGGLREFAKRKHMYVLRNVKGKEVKIPFHYDAVMQGTGQDVVLKPGDKIVVR
jgi:polysaccharide biosynthesis/export protein